MDNVLKEKAHEIIAKLKNSPTIKKLIDWYGNLTPRDALVVKSLSVLIVLALIFTWIINPVIKGKASAEYSLSQELKFHNKLKENAYLFGGTTSASPSKGSILSIVNQTAKAKGVQLKRFEPEGKNGLRVWLEKVNFNSAIDWLEILEAERGLSVEQVSIDKVSSGIVNIRAVLKR